MHFCARARSKAPSGAVTWIARASLCVSGGKNPERARAQNASLLLGCAEVKVN